MNSPWPKQMRQKFKDLTEMAQFCFPEGSIIRCKPCGVERKCSTDEIAIWLKEGYPLCKRCGARTELLNPHIKKVEFE